VKGVVQKIDQMLNAKYGPSTLAVFGILIAMCVAVARYFSGMFSVGAWSGGLALLVFAWIGRSIATGEGSPASTHEFA
jgi:hypothetical protein